MARPCVARRSVKRANVKAASMYQTSGVEHLMLRARMGIRAHPTLTKRKTSKVSHIGTQSLGCAGQAVRPSPHSISQTSVGKLLNRSIFDPFTFFYSSRVNQADVMPEWLDLVGYVMRARPGFQANKAGRQIDKPADELASRYLEAHGDRAALIKADQVERVLADVQADGGDGVG